MLVACDISDKTQDKIVFGSIWCNVSDGTLGNITSEILNFRINEKCWGSFKWSKSKDDDYVEKYKKFLDIFFTLDLNYSCLVVDKDILRTHGSHMGSSLSDAIPNLTVMHISRRALRYCPTDSELTVLLDRGEHTRQILKVKQELKLYMFGHLPETRVKIKDVQEIDSKKLALMQMCDIFTGAVAKAFNGNRTSVSNKTISDHIEVQLGRSLSTPTAPYTEKFNIWSWRPTNLTDEWTIT